MFDVFATILSAGVVISVVTLVVHEPLLLAAGISTILGLMFLLLPLFTTMVPVLGYLLMFTGIVGLGYGVLSTRSWLNVLHARRLQAQARRQQLYAARARDDAPAAAPAAEPVRRRDEDADDELPPRLAAQLDRDEAPGAKGASALARVGRRLGRAAPEPEPEIEIETKPAGKPWRNPYAPAGEPETRHPAPASQPQPQPQPQPAPIVAAPPAPTPAPAPPPEPPRAAKPAKPLSRGAERIKRIKEESRRALAPRRPKTRAVAAPPPEPPPPPAPPPPPPPPPPQPAPDQAAAQRARRQRDLMELELMEIDRPEAAERRPAARDEGDEPKGATFLSRIARRG